MRIQILGGGNNQLNAIIRAKEKGHEVVLTDYYKDPPGRPYADFSECISTFDVAGNMEVAKAYQVDGIMTMGTDQPVYTVACVAKKQNLPRFLEPELARAVTNKEKMKAIFSEAKIPSVAYVLIGQEAVEADLAGLDFPVVLKPIDSQGQRGIFKLNSPKAVIDHLGQTLSFSRSPLALVEEYYQSDELTVSAWVENQKATVLTITDRLSIEMTKHIGICYAHEFPSKHQNRTEEIKGLIDAISQAFAIKNGPLYVQLLVGPGEIVVNEVACRIGGAYEDVFIPYLTGFDILEAVIDYSLGQEVALTLDDSLDKAVSVQLFFARPGLVKALTPLATLKECPGVIGAGYNIVSGQRIKEISNATGRAGYLVITGRTQAELAKNRDRVLGQLMIMDEKGDNLLIRF